jgi:hypothetical protein
MSTLAVSCFCSLSDTIFSAADRLLLPAGCVVRRKGLEREGDGEVDASNEQIWRGGSSASPGEEEGAAEGTWLAADLRRQGTGWVRCSE